MDIMEKAEKYESYMVEQYLHLHSGDSGRQCLTLMG